MSTFGDVLGRLENGRTFDQLNDALQEVAEAVGKHRKVGEISLKIKISPNGEGAVSVVPDLKVKVPEAPRAVTVFFVDQYGNLVRRDPRQSELPLKEVVDVTTGELRHA